MNSERRLSPWRSKADLMRLALGLLLIAATALAGLGTNPAARLAIWEFRFLGKLVQ